MLGSGLLILALIISFVGIAEADRVDEPAYTLFLAHYDGTTADNGRDTDLASGSTVLAGSGGKIWERHLDVSGNTLGTQTAYTLANNFNVHEGTIEMWIRSDQWGTVQDVNGALFWSTWNGWGGAIFFKETAAVAIEGYWSDFGPGGGDWYVRSAALNLDDQWHHIAFEWNLAQQTTAIYLDGVKLRDQTNLVSNDYGSGAAPIHPWVSNLGPLFEVGTFQGGYNAFNGEIDEVRVSNLDRYQGQAFVPQIQAWQSAPPPDPFFGDALHSIPDGDLNQDCVVKLVDYTLVGQFWLVDTNP